MTDLKHLKIAIVCDWLTNTGGAEKVILGLHRLFPTAPIYTSIYNPQKVKGFENAKIHTSWLQNLPFAKNKHQWYFPFMPGVFERFNLNEYDIVISSSHSCAKGIITKPKTLHICYCHSPMRYAWENSIQYVKEYEVHPLVKSLAPWVIHKIRLWDRLSAERVDSFIANSQCIQHRIRKYYRKESTVIHPFVDLDKFSISTEKGKYFLAVGRLISYKKFDLIVEVFNSTKLPLKIAGTGVDAKKLERLAQSNIEFLGYVNDEQLARLYQKAKALVFPQIEDFGIIPLEAMASGCPVIAYDQGGATETVLPGKTGVFFNEQTPEALEKAITQFEKLEFDPAVIRKHTEKFSEKVFQQKLLKFIEQEWSKWLRLNESI